MISVSEARNFLQKITPQNTIELKLQDSAGYILAGNALATCDVPQFNNSAMDGYAFRFSDWNGNPLRLKGESAAGTPSVEGLQFGEAMRIFTGAEVPNGADTVVMQEKTRIENEYLWIEDDKLEPGSNVRLRASQSGIGEIVATTSDLLTPGMVGFLAGLGIAKVKVFARPKVAVVVTGNEIVQPGNSLSDGQVYECNSFALHAALRQLGITPDVFFCKDSELEIAHSIGEVLPSCEVLLVTGGVSVGDYDFVISALQQNGVDQLFHKVKQKPAKPLYLGKKDNTLVFGLPGNPGSVLTAYYVYVLPYLKRLCGVETVGEIYAEITTEFKRKPGLTQFIKGYLEQGKVRIVSGQESYRMDGFAHSNCLIEVPEEVEVISAGTMVKIIPF